MLWQIIANVIKLKNLFKIAKKLWFTKYVRNVNKGTMFLKMKVSVLRILRRGRRLYKKLLRL